MTAASVGGCWGPNAIWPVRHVGIGSLGHRYAGAPLVKSLRNRTLGTPPPPTSHVADMFPRSVRYTVRSPCSNTRIVRSCQLDPTRELGAADGDPSVIRTEWFSCCCAPGRRAPGASGTLRTAYAEVPLLCQPLPESSTPGRRERDHCRVPSPLMAKDTLMSLRLLGSGSDHGTCPAVYATPAGDLVARPRTSPSRTPSSLTSTRRAGHVELLHHPLIQRSVRVQRVARPIPSALSLGSRPAPGR